MNGFDLILSVVNEGQGGRALRAAKRAGARGGTVFLGMGTASSKLLAFLELQDVRREVVLVVVAHENTDAVVDALDREFSLRKPKRGMAVTIRLSGLFGAGGAFDEGERRRVSAMHRAIFAVVDRGRADEVVEAGKSAGARGGTVIHGRGSGIHETEMLFAMAIEPEKDIVLMVVPSGIEGAVVEAVRSRLQLDEPGKGVLFVVDVQRALGLS